MFKKRRFLIVANRINENKMVVSLTWAIAIFSGNNIEPFKILCENELERYKKSSNAIFEFARDIRIYAFQKSNFEDFERLLEEYSKDEHLREIIGKPPINPQVDKILIELNRHLLNLLSTIRTFLDYADYNLKRKHGKNSKLVGDFTRARQYEYSNCFSYRFLYRLRNCAQHYILPLELSLTSKEIEPYSGNIENSMKLSLSRDSLLNSGFDWGKMLEEVKNLPEQVEINPYILEVDKCIDRLQSVILKGKLSFLIECAEYIKLLFRDKLEEGLPCLMKLDESNKKTSTHSIELSWVPISYIEIVDKLRNVQQGSKEFK
jgi:hypothetical protein